MVEDGAEARLRILLVDDDEGVVKALSRQLTRLGSDVRCTGSFQGAVELLAGQDFDLAILDLALSPRGLEGFAILRGIRACWPGMPVVLLTGQVTPALEAEGLRLGANAVVEKAAVDALARLVQNITPRP
jgi:DNA-binding response OmpR family regulator